MNWIEWLCQIVKSHCNSSVICTFNKDSNSWKLHYMLCLYIRVIPKKYFQHLTKFFISTWWGNCKNMQEIDITQMTFRTNCKKEQPIQPIQQQFFACLGLPSKIHFVNMFFCQNQKVAKVAFLNPSMKFKNSFDQKIMKMTFTNIAITCPRVRQIQDLGQLK